MHPDQYCQVQDVLKKPRKTALRFVYDWREKPEVL
jgi:hypothetical protein